MKTVLFFRKLRQFFGGHLKVYDYFNHVLSSPHHTARIYFYEASVWDWHNPWRDRREYVVSSPASVQPDALFLGGTDWAILTEAQRAAVSLPRINRIAHVRHADPSNVRYSFLGYRAIRICNSEQTADALRATGRVEGPLFVIPNCLDFAAFPELLPLHKRSLDLLIVANKQPRRGRILRAALLRPNRRIQLLTGAVRRSVFLFLMNMAKVTLYVPNPTEGFYNPPLEGMRLQTIVVCPDCVGNRGHCLPGWNCFRPEYNILAMLAATEAALRLSEDERKAYLNNASLTAQRHDIQRERQQFLEILNNLDQIW